MTRLSPRLQAVVDALPLQPGSRVLEIGCGSGAAARAIANRLDTGHILAIDRSAKAIDQARANAADEIASGRLAVRHVAAEEFVLQPDEAPYDIVSRSASAPSTVAIPRPVSRFSCASRRRPQPARVSSSTAAIRCGSSRSPSREPLVQAVAAALQAHTDRATSATSASFPRWTWSVILRSAAVSAADFQRQAGFLHLAAGQPDRGRDEVRQRRRMERRRLHRGVSAASRARRPPARVPSARC